MITTTMSIVMTKRLDIFMMVLIIEMSKPTLIEVEIIASFQEGEDTPGKVVGIGFCIRRELLHSVKLLRKSTN